MFTHILMVHAPIYINIYLFIYIYTYSYMHSCKYTYKYAVVHLYTYICVWTCMCIIFNARCTIQLLLNEYTQIRRHVHLHACMLGVWACIIARARGNVIYTWLGHTHAVEFIHAVALYTRGGQPIVLNRFTLTTHDSHTRFANTGLGEHK